VPPVFAQVRGDAVRARRLANPRGLDGTRLAEAAPAIPRLAQSRDMVNVDAELEHKNGKSFSSGLFSAKYGTIWQTHSHSDCADDRISVFIRRDQNTHISEILAAGVGLDDGDFFRVR